MKSMKFSRTNLFILIILLALFSGCGSIGTLSEPIGKYRIATQGVVSTSREYFLNMNRLERNYKFTEAYANKTPIDTTVTNAVFNADGIKARMRALALIDLYSARLAEIVGLDVNESLTKNTKALGESLNNLGTTIDSITGDDTIMNYSGPVTSLVGFVSSIWIEQERKKALATAIKKASPEVSKILILLENDLKKAHDDRLEYSLLKFNELRIKYNDEKDTLNDNDRRKRLNELEQLYNSYEEVISTPPDIIITKMRNAHDAMTKAADNLDKIENFKDFVAAVDVFAASVSETAKVYNSFKNLN